MLIAVWLLLLMLKLAGTVDISYAHVWAPWWAAVGIVFTCCSWGLIIRRCARRASNTSMWHNQDDGSERALGGLFAKAINDKMGDDTPRLLRFTWFVLVALLSFVVLPALLQAKLDGQITAHWAAIFSPVWIVSLLFCTCSACAVRKCFRDSDMSIMLHIFGSFCFLLPLIIVLVMLVVRLEGIKNIQLSLMFIPFWVADALMIAAGAVMAIALACCNDDDDEPELKVAACGLCCLPICFFLPFQIVGSVYDGLGKEIPAIGMMTPLVVLLFLLACGACGVMCALWSKSRSESFTDAYNLRAWRTGTARPAIIPGIQNPLNHA